jgi:hypothetical protein
MERRGIAWRRTWTDSLNAALHKLRETPAPSAKIPRCQRLAQIALWADVDLGTTEAQWPDRAEFFAEMKRNFPGIEQPAQNITGQIRKLDLSGLEVHQQALALVFTELKRYAVENP